MTDYGFIEGIYNLGVFEMICEFIGGRHFAVAMKYIFSFKYIVYFILGISSVTSGGYFYLTRPVKIIPEYSLLTPSSVSLTFWICLVVLIAIFLLPKKYKKFIVLPAPSLLFILLVKQLLLSLKWQSFSIIKEINLLLDGNSNCERVIIIVFTLFWLFYSVIALYTNLSISSLVLGFIVVGFDAIVSKSFYFTLFPIFQSLNFGEIFQGELSLSKLVFIQCLAFFYLFMALSLVKALWNYILKAKKKYF